MRHLRGRTLLRAATLGIASVLLAAPAALAASPVAAAGAGYRVIDLGTLLPGGRSFATAINERGDVVGASDGHAVLWRDGQIIDLGVLPEGSTAVATDLNERDEVVGYGSNDYSTSAFVWRNGQMSALELLPGADNCLADGINDKGQIVGRRTAPSGHGTRAVTWLANGRAVDLDPTGSSSLARDIANNGWIVGEMVITEDPWYGGSAVWRHGVPTVIHPGTAMAVNERRQIVGIGGGSYLWSRGVVTDLGRPAGATSFEPVDINNRTQVVGNSDGAFVWRRGVFTALPSLAGDPATAAAAGINDRGQIVGYAEAADGLTAHAVLWTR
ncbi:MAG TPA: hypothetical protein VFU43_27210 [Streptosporangiaceae bacterium]|nr:hypothetical protein [Streptosporangiaceae bacterium]